MPQKKQQTTHDVNSSKKLLAARRGRLLDNSKPYRQTKNQNPLQPFLFIDDALVFHRRGCSAVRYICATGHVGVSATTHESLAELLPLLGRHLLPARAHSSRPMPAMSPAASEPAKEYFAQDQKAQRLPETNAVPAENSRHKPIPQFHDNKTENGHKNNCHQRYSQNSCNSISHFQSLILLQIHRGLPGAAGAGAPQRCACARAGCSCRFRFPLPVP